MDLIGESSATGQDDFTGLKLTDYDSTIDTRLKDDFTIEKEDGIVVN